VFVTAKDRIYNPATGKIVSNSSKYVRRYQEIIEIIQRTVFPDVTEKVSDSSISYAEDRIQSYSGKMLIIIDDYETFIDEEKVKISNFIKTLDINHHKVVITTRNLRLSIGMSIPTNEFDIDKTCDFLQKVIQQDSPSLLADIIPELENMNCIATKDYMEKMILYLTICSQPITSRV
jgi:hypothetical protein